MFLHQFLHLIASARQVLGKQEEEAPDRLSHSAIKVSQSRQIMEGRSGRAEGIRGPPPPCMWLGPKTKKSPGTTGNSLERQETHTEESPRRTYDDKGSSCRFQVRITEHIGQEMVQGQGQDIIVH